MPKEQKQMGPFMPTRFETRKFKNVEDDDEYTLLGATKLEAVVLADQLYSLDLPDKNFEQAITNIDGLTLGEDAEMKVDPDQTRSPNIAEDPREMDLFFIVGVNGSKEAGHPAIALFERS